MSAPRYKLTTAGKVVCVLLALLLVVSIYFVVNRYFLTHDSILDEQPTGQIQDSENSSGKVEDQENTSDSSVIASPGTVSPSPIEPDTLTASDLSSYKGTITRISVYFDPESSTLNSDALDTLNTFVEEYTGLTRYAIALEANCATTVKGPLSEDAQKEHQALAEARADSVLTYLNDNNMKNHVAIMNYGANNPDNDNSTFIKRVQNRRVDIVLYH